MNAETAITYPALQSAMSADEDHNLSTSPQGQSMSSPSSLFLMESVKSPCPSPRESATNRGAESKRNTDVDKKPPGLSYIALISMAIQSSDTQKKLLSEIYQWIADRYPYYQMKDKSWRNSIRHNLSLNECFVKSGRSENGKGNYWSIHPANIDDFAKGDFRRRRARRRVRICDKDLQMLCSNDGLTKSPPPVQKPKPYDGYIPMASTTVPASFMTSFGPEPMKCQADWYQPEYYSCKPYDYKPFQPIMPPRDTVCHYQGNPGQLNTDFLPYGNNMSYPAPNTPGTSAQVDSKFNVNVSVNVCGSGSSSQQTSPQQPLQTTTPQHEQQQHQLLHQDLEAHHQQQHHPLFMPHHFQSAYTSQYSHMYGTTYQELMAPSVL